MRYIFFLLAVGLFFANCGNDLAIPTTDPVEQLATDKALIKNYLTQNGLSSQAQETSSGLHYIVEDAGSGDFIDQNSIINILLKGYYLEDNFVFDETDDCSPVTLNLSGVIDGFREGIQFFNTGGKGSLFIPSELAFGQTGNGAIPANKVLAFDIEVVDQKFFDLAKIKTYLAENNINADSTLSGIFYTITEPGEGESPTASSTVTVNYRGYFANGTVFDQTNDAPASFGLNNVIRGWTEALQLLKPGGSGTFLIPSNLAYGETGSGSIPPNTMIIFDIELVDFN